MRVYALYLYVLILSIYAYRDWFRSLCGLILLTSVYLHPDFANNMFGIQGLNPWNLLLLNVVMGWLINRRREGLVWDMPRHVNIMLLLYLFIALASFCRMMLDRRHLEAFTTSHLVSEFLINTIKWVVPGLLLFDGCRSRRRLVLALVSTLGVYFLLSAQVIRWMPPSAAVSGEVLTARSRRLILNEVGYNPVHLSMLLSGAFWAILATLPLVKRRIYQVITVFLGLVVVYAQALTAGRMGYVTWAILGLILGVLRYRRYLLFAPLVVALLAAVVPGAVERMLEGFHQTDVLGQTYTDDYIVTSGRTLIWPYVIDSITAAPLIGYGRHAMLRTGLADFLLKQYGESFPHPHNAYLEWLLDNGIIGFLIVMPFYGLIVLYAVQLFRDAHRPSCAAAGGVALALVLALLIAAMGSGSFYPREGALGMWAAIGLMLRMWVARRKAGGLEVFSLPRAATQATHALAPARPARLVQPRG